MTNFIYGEPTSEKPIRIQAVPSAATHHQLSPSRSFMADQGTNVQPSDPFIDPATGFCSATNTFHSLRRTLPIPPPSVPLSSATYMLSHLSSSPLPSSPALIDSASGHTLSYTDFIACIRSLSSSLQPLLSPPQVALILSPSSVHIPILYFSLLSLGIVISPINPTSTASEISRQVHISRPTIAFTTSAYARKLPPSLPTILLDSPHFISMLTAPTSGAEIQAAQVSQSDLALILYSSGTTGGVKGVAVTHRNIISCFTAIKATGMGRKAAVALVPLPLFHAFGFSYCLTALGMGETLVLMERFDMGRMVKAVEELGVTLLLAAPPIVVRMVKDDGVDPYRLRSLERVVSSSAPLAVEMMERFKAKFPAVQLAQVSEIKESKLHASIMH